MSRQILVNVGDVDLYVEVESEDGAAVVGLSDRLNFQRVRDAVEAIAEQFSTVWAKTKPSEATVEFGLKLTTKSGQLSGLLVEGGGEAALAVTITWKQDQNNPKPMTA